MTATSATVAGRRAAIRNMLDTCSVVRPGVPVTNASTGAVTTPTTVLYSGRCKVQATQVEESNPVAGAHSFTVQRYSVHVPVGSFDPHVGDVVTILTSALDVYLMGRSFVVVALLHKSQATAYRLAVVEQVA